MLGVAQVVMRFVLLLLSWIVMSGAFITQQRVAVPPQKFQQRLPSAQNDENAAPKEKSLQRVKKGFNVLELGLPGGQGLLVTMAKWGWKFIWTKLLVELAPQDENGSYKRTGYNIKTGELGSDMFPIEKGRYHIYVGNPCPWCHRVNLAHKLYEVSDVIGISFAADDPTKARRGGWYFSEDKKDPIWNEYDLLGVYNRCNPVQENQQYVGRCTLPLIVDTKTQTIVSNESRDIVRMLRKASEGPDLAPDNLLTEMEELQLYIYENINNGVYRCGFSSEQTAYDKAIKDVFEGLSRVNDILGHKRFLHGDKITETDLFLLPTAVRFDGIYHSFFKCGLTTIARSYPNILRWMHDMHGVKGVRGCFDHDDAKRSYYQQLFPLNPSGIISATQEATYFDVLNTVRESEERSREYIKRDK